MMNLIHSKLNYALLRRPAFLFYCICTIVIASGCSTTIKMSYSPAYFEKIKVVKSNLSKAEPISVVILPFKDKRKIRDPSLIYKKISLDNQTLSEYLYDALSNDLNMVGFNVIKNHDMELSIKEIESGKKTIPNNIDFVLAIEINKCIPGYENNFTTIQGYSTFDFKIIIWDNTLSKVVYDRPFSKKIMGVETTVTTFIDMVDKLLNEDLTVVNIEIAEILATNISRKSSHREIIETDTEMVCLISV